MPIFRRTICIITASGIVTLCKRLYSTPDECRLKWAPEVLYSRVKQPGHENDNLSACTAEAVRPRNHSSIPSRNKRLSF